MNISDITKTLKTHIATIENLHHVVDYYPLFTNKADLQQFMHQNRLNIAICAVKATQQSFGVIYSEPKIQYECAIDVIYGYNGMAAEHQQFTTICHNITTHIDEHFLINNTNFSTVYNNHYGLWLKNTELIQVANQYPALRAVFSLYLTKGA